MIDSFLFLQGFGFFGGGAIGALLNQWAQIGVFSYAIPFLLIFALVFGILTRMNLFKKSDGQGGEKSNGTINGIIALSVGLMALQFPTVPIFFAELFPALGVGISVILVILVISGLFIDPNNKGFMVGLMVVSLIIAGIVIFSSTWALGIGGFGAWWNFYGGTAIGIIIFLVFIGVIIASANPVKQNPPVNNLLAQALGGGK